MRRLPEFEERSLPPRPKPPVRRPAARPVTVAQPEPPVSRSSMRLAERPRRRRTPWQWYAMPLALIATVLVIVGLDRFPNDAGRLASSAESRAQVGQGGVGQGAPPVVNPPSPAPVAMPKANPELPDGDPIPISGSGQFQIVPGTSPKAGSGRVYRYTVEIESGAAISEKDATEFGASVQDTLSSPRSWIGGGLFSVQRVASGYSDFQVTLVSQGTADQVCGGGSIKYPVSCYLGQNRVYINAARWVRGAGAFKGDLNAYRQYAINHEVGHRFGNNHQICAGPGRPAPVMMQQTLSVSNDELADVTGNIGQGLVVPHNGAVCTANSWPYP
ncbi:DUF3152 domain-containing protein [Pseudonocardiaceae bacterium YIM PH 21723]|nr:DUF3152 domain-containing protein [Pseudonocardiaceae bacterium YIM PH 21723]